MIVTTTLALGYLATIAQPAQEPLIASPLLVPAVEDLATYSQWDLFPIDSSPPAIDPEYAEGVDQNCVEPIGFTEITFLPPPPPPPPPIVVLSVDLSVISSVGGELLTITGTFPIDQTVQVHMGPLGTIEDPLCYGGQGLGYEVLSLDGTTIQFTAPPLTKGDIGIVVTIGVYATELPVGTLKAVERNWPGKLHRARANFPPWEAVGGRKLGEEGLE